MDDLLSQSIIIGRFKDDTRYEGNNRSVYILYRMRKWRCAGVAVFSENKQEALDADADLANETIQVIFREVLLGRTNIVDTYTQKKIIKFYPHVHHDSFSLKAQQFHVYWTSRNISFCKIIG